MTCPGMSGSDRDHAQVDAGYIRPMPTDRVAPLEHGTGVAHPVDAADGSER